MRTRGWLPSDDKDAGDKNPKQADERETLAPAALSPT